MNTHITSILPVKMEPQDGAFQSWYNQGVDDCATAIERANLVVCPTEEELFGMLHKIYYESKYEYIWDGESTNVALLAKELLALLHRTAPQGER